MAKKSSKGSPAIKKMKQNISKKEIPLGFTGIFSASFVNWEETPTVQGVVKQLREIPNNFKKKSMVRVMDIILSDGAVIIVQDMGALHALFDQVKISDEVFIHFTGELKHTGKGNPMKVFQVAIKAVGSLKSKSQKK